MSDDTSEIPEHLAIPQRCVTLLKGHTMEVFVCAWNPVSSYLASGSGDSTARCVRHTEHVFACLSELVFKFMEELW